MAVNLRRRIESEYLKQSEEFTSSAVFQALERGEATRQDYDLFIEGICRSHLKSPHILAFLFALAPPEKAEELKHNMLEELGLDGEGVSHPALLLKLMVAAGFDESLRQSIEHQAVEELRRTVASPILYGTLKELGLSVLMETVAFEWMLSRVASRISYFLKDHRQIPAPALHWFHHHSEVDVRHSEEGLDAIEAYARFYEIDAGDAETILEVTFRENVFLKRYFGVANFTAEAFARSL